ncbi:MAG: hypothetical protein ACHRHE_20945, partial [Tepidisphaerales bacterium]
VEMGAGFLGVGNTLEERQNRLNAACSAWNIACHPQEMHTQGLDRYTEGYLRSNPATSPGDLANIRKDMETLIQRKLQMFPDDRRRIVGARVLKVGTEFRIETESANFE